MSRARLGGRGQRRRDPQLERTGKQTSAAQVWGIGSTAAAFLVAHGLALLLAGRFVEGLMVGGVPAIAVAYLTEEVNPVHAARARLPDPSAQCRLFRDLR